MKQDSNDGVVANKSTTVMQAATSNTHTSAPTPGSLPTGETGTASVVNLDQIIVIPSAKGISYCGMKWGRAVVVFWSFKPRSVHWFAALGAGFVDIFIGQIHSESNDQIQ